MIRAPVALLFVLAALFLNVQGQEEGWYVEMPDENVPFFNKTKIVVCTTPWTPAVVCSPDTDPLTWTGFEIEVFRTTATRMGLRPEMLDWRCYDDKRKLLDDLYSSTCDLAAAGMAPLPDRIEKGLRFSVPSIRSGFSIMVSKIVEPPGMWYFFSAMAWEVWVLMIATGVIVGVIVWLFEVGMRALNTDTHNMSNVMWDTLGRPVQMRDYRLASFPANLTAILWSFLVFILMVIYSANLTANLTINQFKNDIRGLQDLPGKAVGSWEGYQDELKKYNVATMGMPWNSPEDEVKMIDTLKSGLIKALVFDNNLLQIYDATDCDTMLVGDQFDLRDQCVTFAPNTWQNYPGFVDAFDTAMLTVVQGTGGVEELINRFITVAPAACKNSDLGSGYTSVSISEVAGLWIILAISIGFSAFIVIFYRLWGSKIGPWAAKKGWYNSKHSAKIISSYNTLKRAGFSSEVVYPYANSVDNDDDDEAVQYRYTGASKGYIDGSTDVFPHGVPPVQPVPVQPVQQTRLPEGYMTKRRKKFESRSSSLSNKSVDFDYSQQDGSAGAQHTGVNGGMNTNLSSVSEGVVPSSRRVIFAPSGRHDESSTIAAAAAASGNGYGEIASQSAAPDGVGLPNDSAKIESPRTYANRMATFKLSDEDYDIDGDNLV